MPATRIIVEPIPGGFRAWSPLFPDCEAVAPTEEAAREAVELAIERALQRQQGDNESD